MATITTGDDAELPFHLKKSGTSFPINGAATAKAALVSTDRSTILSAVVDVDMAATGTDLANSLLIVKFTSTESAAITALGEALLEVQLDDGGKLTWTDKITILKGNIP